MRSRFSLFLPAFILALGAFCTPVAAADTYTVPGIHVDVTGSSSTEAFTNAISGGRPKAFQILYRRLTRQQDWVRQPNLDTAALLRISRGYTVANERRSTTRYVADVTYMFNPDAVTRLLRNSEIAYAQTSAKRILVIAMSPGVSNGPWAQALGAPALRDSVVPFSLATAEDDKAMTALNFDAATWNDVAAAATRIHATEAALVQAVPGNGKITVNIRRLGLGQASAKTSTEVALLQTVGATYPAAAQAAVAALDDLWKSHAAVDFSQKGRLTADMRIGSLAEWGEVQSALANVNLVTGVTLVAMDTGYARMSIAYLGSMDQLREAMGAAHLSLTNRSGQWVLAMSS